MGSKKYTSGQLATAKKDQKIQVCKTWLWQEINKSENGFYAAEAICEGDTNLQVNVNVRRRTSQMALLTSRRSCLKSFENIIILCTKYIQLLRSSV